MGADRRGERNAQRVVLIARDLPEPELLTVVEYAWRTGRPMAPPGHPAGAVAGGAACGAVRAGCLSPDLITRPGHARGRLRRSAVTSASVALRPTVGMVPHEADVLRLLAEGLDTRRISEKFA